eukprot:8756717-Alexandrium_andersonii.AAC.1
MGVFWPLELYEKRVGKAKPAQITTLPVDGVPMKGVIREPVEGSPIGTFDVAQVMQQGSVQNTAIHDSDEALHAGEAEAIWKAARKRVTPKLAQKDVGTPEEPCVATTLKPS